VTSREFVRATEHAVRLVKPLLDREADRLALDFQPRGGQIDLHPEQQQVEEGLMVQPQVEQFRQQEEEAKHQNRDVDYQILEQAFQNDNNRFAGLADDEEEKEEEYEDDSCLQDSKVLRSFYDSQEELIFDAQLTTQQLRTWLGNPDAYFSKAYSGLDHGFAARDFKQKVAGKSGILFLAESNFGTYFGGYLSQPVQIVKKEMLFVDKDAFLFSLTHWQDLRQKDAFEYNLGFSPNYMFKLGLPGSKLVDLKIATKCDDRNFCFSDLGHAFELPQGVKKGSDQALNYLGGSN